MTPPAPLRAARAVASAPTSLVPALLRFARGRGGSVADLCGRLALGSPVDLASADEAAATPSTVRALFEAVADACGEPWVGLRLAAERPTARVFEPLFASLAACGTVGDALRAVARHAPAVHPMLRVTVDERDGGVVWCQAPDDGLGRYAAEFTMAFALARCREVLPETTLGASEVSFAHARPRDLVPLQRFFGTSRLAFGTDASAFALDRATAALRPSVREPRGVGGATEAPVSPGAASAAALVAGALRGTLADGPSLAGVARRLALSERTVQRRLMEESTTFLDVLDAVREGTARDLLRDHALPLAVIAERLGFADLATFSRAFKRWTGEPPGMFRRRA